MLQSTWKHRYLNIFFYFLILLTFYILKKIKDKKVTNEVTCLTWACIFLINVTHLEQPQKDHILLCILRCCLGLLGNLEVIMDESLSPFLGVGGKNTRVGCHSLLQEIFLTQGLNPGLPHCTCFTIWATREAVTLYRRQESSPSPWKRNAKKQNGCLRRPYK